MGKKLITTFPDIKSLGRTSTYFYFISRLSVFEECFEFWGGPWSVHNHPQAGISLQCHKGTDCSTGVIKKAITLDRLWDRAQQNLPEVSPPLAAKACGLPACYTPFLGQCTALVLLRNLVTHTHRDNKAT